MECVNALKIEITSEFHFCLVNFYEVQILESNKRKLHLPLLKTQTPRTFVNGFVLHHQ